MYSIIEQAFLLILAKHKGAPIINAPTTPINIQIPPTTTHMQAQKNRFRHRK
jgi:hypothetical protein